MSWSLSKPSSSGCLPGLDQVLQRHRPEPCSSRPRSPGTFRRPSSPSASKPWCTISTFVRPPSTGVSRNVIMLGAGQFGGSSPMRMAPHSAVSSRGGSYTVHLPAELERRHSLVHALRLENAADAGLERQPLVTHLDAAGGAKPERHPLLAGELLPHAFRRRVDLDRPPNCQLSDLASESSFGPSFCVTAGLRVTG